MLWEFDLCFRTLSGIIWAAIMTEFWLISAPGEKNCQQTWDKMNTATAQTNLSTNHKFNIPELKVNDSSLSIPVKTLVYLQHISHSSNEFWLCFSTGGDSGYPCRAVWWACQIGLFRREVSYLHLTFYKSVQFQFIIFFYIYIFCALSTTHCFWYSLIAPKIPLMGLSGFCHVKVL